MALRREPRAASPLHISFINQYPLGRQRLPLKHPHLKGYVNERAASPVSTRVRSRSFLRNEPIQSENWKKPVSLWKS